MKNIQNLAILLVGLIGLLLMFRAIPFVPAATIHLWSSFQTEFPEPGGNSMMVPYAVANLVGMMLYLVIGLTVLKCREPLANFIVKTVSEEESVSSKKPESEEHLARVLVGILGIWFTITGVTHYVMMLNQGEPVYRDNLYYVAYGVQALAGICVFLMNRKISAFLTSKLHGNKNSEPLPGEVRETSSRPSG